MTQQAAFLVEALRGFGPPTQRLDEERQAAYEQEVRSQQEQAARELEARRFIGAFLAQHVPDVAHRLLVYTCVVARCPGCDTITVFFDPGGMNMMPTWTPLAWRATAFH